MDCHVCNIYLILIYVSWINLQAIFQFAALRLLASDNVEKSWIEIIETETDATLIELSSFTSSFKAEMRYVCYSPMNNAVANTLSPSEYFRSLN